jgi:hypothetical protein
MPHTNHWQRPAPPPFTPPPPLPNYRVTGQPVSPAIARPITANG